MNKRTIAQTLAPNRDKIKGSSTNKVGSAKKENSSSIVLSDTTIKVLQDKLKEFKDKHPNNKSITLNDLKAVYRRGSGAFSTSHRPNITRAAWSYARVNKFLEKASGNKVKKAYVQDDDLMKYEQGGKVEKYWYKGLFKTNYFANSDILKKGGVVVGKSHKESDLNGTGEKFKVQSTNEIVELEGGEGVIVGKALKTRDKYNFNGSKKTPREIASFLNSNYGGVKFDKGGEVTCGCSKKKYYHGGELPSAIVDKLEGGEAVITKKTMQSKDKYEYQGRMLTPRQILSDINSKFGGRKF